MSMACPADERECRQLLSTAFEQDHPVAVRYPRGSGAGVAPLAALEGLPFGKGEIRRERWQRMTCRGKAPAHCHPGLWHLAVSRAAGGEAFDATVVNMRWAKPLDVDLLLEVAASHDALVTVEEGAIMGGAGSAVLEALAAAWVVCPVLQLGLPDVFIEHGDPAKLLALQGLDAAGIRHRLPRGFAWQRGLTARRHCGHASR
jgi:1-deoxy-D-xylulose-5-phosphate synthase